MKYRRRHVLLTALALPVVALVSAREIAESRAAAALGAAGRSSTALPPLGERTLEGDAWDDYGPAIASINQASRAIFQELQRQPRIFGADLSERALDRILAECSRDLERIRRGSRRKEIGRPHSVLLGHAPGLLTRSARNCRAFGDWDGALEELTVAARLATDLNHPPDGLTVSICGSVLSEVAEEMAAWVVRGDIPSTALEGVARLVDEIHRVLPNSTTAQEGGRADLAARLIELAQDHSLWDQAAAEFAPRLEGLRGEIRWRSELGDFVIDLDEIRECLERALPESRDGSRMVVTWREGWSARALVARFQEEHDIVSAAIRSGEDRDWPAAKAMLEQAFTRIDDDGNVMDRVLYRFGSHEEPWVNRELWIQSVLWPRVFRARLRLAGAVARYRSGRGPDAPGWPIDPFDLQPIRVQVDGTRVTFRCVWKDGRSGSDGGWKPKGEEADLTIEWNRDGR